MNAATATPSNLCKPLRFPSKGAAETWLAETGHDGWAHPTARQDWLAVRTYGNHVVAFYSTERAVILEGW